MKKTPIQLPRCLARRMGKEVVEMLAAELGLDIPNRNEALSFEG